MLGVWRQRKVFKPDFIDSLIANATAHAGGTSSASSGSKTLVRLMNFRLCTWVEFGYLLKTERLKAVLEDQQTSRQDDAELIARIEGWFLCLPFVNYVTPGLIAVRVCAQLFQRSIIASNPSTVSQVGEGLCPAAPFLGHEQEANTCLHQVVKKASTTLLY